MPNFGEFETIGEPLAVTKEAGHVSYVWQARRADGHNSGSYAVKCYAPRPRPQGSLSAGATLGIDRGLEFLEGIKQLEETRAKGARGLARIYGFGKTPASPETGLSAEGAWYATDYCVARTLKEWIGIGGRIDSHALRKVVSAVLWGCIALKQSRGHSHGNLKPSNILIGGNSGSLSTRKLFLTDPYPAAPSRLNRLDPPEQREITDLFRDAVETQDLQALGRIILQLVELRLLGSGSEYDYPDESSPHWPRLGKSSKYWLELCKQLLDPSLSLDKISFNTRGRVLADEFPQPKQIGPILIRTAAITLGIALLGGLAYGGRTGWEKYWFSRTVRASQEKAKAEEAWKNSWVAAQSELAATNFGNALGRLGRARDAAKKLQDSLRESEASGLFALVQSLELAKQEADRQEPNYKSLLTLLSNARTQISETNLVLWRNGAEETARNNAAIKCTNLLKNAYVQLDNTNTTLDEVNKLFQESIQFAKDLIDLAPQMRVFQGQGEQGLVFVGKIQTAQNYFATNPPLAEKLALELLKDRDHNLRARHITNQIASAKRDFTQNLQSFVSEIENKWGGPKKVPPELHKLARNNFTNTPTLNASVYAPPSIWKKIASTNQNFEVGALNQELSAKLSPEVFIFWSNRVEMNYAAVPDINELATGWPPEDLTARLDGLKNSSEGAVSNSLPDLKPKADWVATQARHLNETARSGGNPKAHIRARATELIKSNVWIADQLTELTQTLTQTELAKQLALAREAYMAGITNGDFSKAVSICTNYPNEKRFDELKKDAIAQIQKYNDLLQKIASLLKTGDYSNVISNEKFTGSPDVQKLKQQAESENEFMITAKNLISQCKYSEASNWIQTLPHKPASDLRTRIDILAKAQTSINRLLSEEKFEDATNAFEALTSETRHEPCLKRLYDLALTGVNEVTAFNLANEQFGLGHYEEASRLCGTNTSQKFETLRNSIATEKGNLDSGKALLKLGNYEGLKTQFDRISYSKKAPFSEISSNAVEEAKILAELQVLKGTNNWKALNSRTNELKERLTTEIWSKPPFRVIADWLDNNHPRREFEKEFKLYCVLYGLDRKNTNKVMYPGTSKHAIPLAPGSITLEDYKSVNNLSNKCLSSGLHEKEAFSKMSENITSLLNK
jgi:hypothetical protein